MQTNEDSKKVKPIWKRYFQTISILLIKCFHLVNHNLSIGNVITKEWIYHKDGNIGNIAWKNINNYEKEKKKYRKLKK